MTPPGRVGSLAALKPAFHLMENTKPLARNGLTALLAVAALTLLSTPPLHAAPSLQ